MTPEQLREARIRAGMSQEAVAGRLGVTQATISNWENGVTRPHPPQIETLGGFLDLEPETDEDEGEAPSSSPYGEWLLRVRTEKGMTRRELSEHSGVSEPQIWNIETGYTRNPRSGTRDRLQAALGETTPTETVEVTEEDAEIPNVGTLTDFDPHDDADLPMEPGVYVLYDISDRPIYVGQGEDIRARLRDHRDKFWYRAPIVQAGAFVRIPEQTLREQVEATMIRFLKSNAVVNRQHVRRGATQGVG